MDTMKRILLTLLAAIALTVSALVTVAAASTPRPTTWTHFKTSSNHYLPHCGAEDGGSTPKPCVWYGEVDGNGSGASYLVINNSGDASSFVYFTVDQP